MRRLLLFLLIDLVILVGAASAQDVTVRYQGQAISSRGLPLPNHDDRNIHELRDDAGNSRQLDE